MGVARVREGQPLRRIDIKVYPVEEFAYALLYFTGSDHFNRSMRHYAKARGYSLSDHGIVHATKVDGHHVVRGTRNLFPAKCEADIFAALGLDFVEPHARNTEVAPASHGAPPLALGGQQEAIPLAVDRDDTST